MSSHLDLGQPIGKGWSSEVYNWKDNKVIKLYHKHIPRSFLEHEIEATRFARYSGICTPAVDNGIIQIKNRYGICFERIDGNTLSQILDNNPDKQNEIFTLMAELQINVNKIKTDKFPSYRKEIDQKIRKIRFLPRDIRKKTLAELNLLEKRNNLCHGDFNPDNIIVSESGDLFLIDWSHARSGNPLIEITRSLIIGNIFFRDLNSLYTEIFFSTAEITQDIINPWIPILATSLIYDIPKKRMELLEIARCRKLAIS